jgi:hypothetical protein
MKRNVLFALAGLVSTLGLSIPALAFEHDCDDGFRAPPAPVADVRYVGPERAGYGYGRGYEHERFERDRMEQLARFRREREARERLERMREMRLRFNGGGWRGGWNDGYGYGR